jgi:hypothetical protein
VVIWIVPRREEDVELDWIRGDGPGRRREAARVDYGAWLPRINCTTWRADRLGGLDGGVREPDCDAAEYARQDSNLRPTV